MDTRILPGGNTTYATYSSPTIPYRPSLCCGPPAECVFLAFPHPPQRYFKDLSHCHLETSLAFIDLAAYRYTYVISRQKLTMSCPVVIYMVLVPLYSNHGVIVKSCQIPRKRLKPIQDLDLTDIEASDWKTSMDGSYFIFLHGDMPVGLVVAYIPKVVQ